MPGQRRPRFDCIFWSFQMVWQYDHRVLLGYKRKMDAAYTESPPYSREKKGLKPENESLLNHYLIIMEAIWPHLLWFPSCYSSHPEHQTACLYGRTLRIKPWRETFGRRCRWPTILNFENMVRNPAFADVGISLWLGFMKKGLLTPANPLQTRTHYEPDAG